MSRYIAAYDVSSNRRRRQVARALLGWGERLQESVFEVSISPEEMDDFQLSLGLVLGATDLFDLIPIDNRQPSRRKRWRRPFQQQPVVIMG